VAVPLHLQLKASAALRGKGGSLLSATMRTPPATKGRPAGSMARSKDPIAGTNASAQVTPRHRMLIPLVALTGAGESRRTMIQTTDLGIAVEHALRAPSVHNTQPWP
jgi:hypothetical protein